MLSCSRDVSKGLTGEAAVALLRSDAVAADVVVKSPQQTRRAAMVVVEADSFMVLVVAVVVAVAVRLTWMGMKIVSRSLSPFLVAAIAMNEWRSDVRILCRVDFPQNGAIQHNQAVSTERKDTISVGQSLFAPFQSVSNGRLWLQSFYGTSAPTCRSSANQ